MLLFDPTLQILSMYAGMWYCFCYPHCSNYWYCPCLDYG